MLRSPAFFRPASPCRLLQGRGEQGMKTLQTSHEYSAETPLDVVERVVSARNWSFDRRGEMEMAVQVPGHWCDYSLYFSWNGDVGAMHFSCAFDMRVPPEKRRPINDLVMLINE